MANNSQIKTYWEEEYKDTKTPFDIDKPDEWIANLEQRGLIRGNVLDAGCGPGRTALFLANRGYPVLGIDISSLAIERAREKARLRGTEIQFQRADICRLANYNCHFDTVVDIGCFHSLCIDDRSMYAATLHRICRPEAMIYLRAFSIRNGVEIHPSGLQFPAISEEQIRNNFVPNGWVIKDLVEKEIELFISEMHKPKTYCWFAQMQYA